MFLLALDPAQDLQFLKVTSSSATAQWKKSRARAEGYRISVALYDGDGASILTEEVNRGFGVGFISRNTNTGMQVLIIFVVKKGIGHFCITAFYTQKRVCL